MKSLDMLAATLLIVGGLNWGLVAVAEFDLVAMHRRPRVRRDERGQPLRLRPGRDRRRSTRSAPSSPRARRETPRPSRPASRIHNTKGMSPMKKFLPIGVLAAVVMSIAGAPASARPNEDKNIVQTAGRPGRSTRSPSSWRRPVSPARSPSRAPTPCSHQPTRLSEGSQVDAERTGQEQGDAPEGAPVPRRCRQGHERGRRQAELGENAERQVRANPDDGRLGLHQHGEGGQAGRDGIERRHPRDQQGPDPAAVAMPDGALVRARASAPSTGPRRGAFVAGSGRQEGGKCDQIRNYGRERRTSNPRVGGLENPLGHIKVPANRRFWPCQRPPHGACWELGSTFLSECGRVQLPSKRAILLGWPRRTNKRSGLSDAAGCAALLPRERPRESGATNSSGARSNTLRPLLSPYSPCCAGHDRHGLGHRVRLGRDDSHTPAEPHDLDAVGELEDMRHVVADQDHRQPALAHAADQIEHLPRLLDAERGGRLVHDHDRRAQVAARATATPWR